jgi:hypothetical protein
VNRDQDEISSTSHRVPTRDPVCADAAFERR